MVVVFVGYYQCVDPPAGVCCDVRNDLGSAVVNALRPKDYAAIDQHMPGNAVLLWQCDQKTVAQSLSVHPYRCPPCRRRWRGPAC